MGRRVPWLRGQGRWGSLKAVSAEAGRAWPRLPPLHRPLPGVGVDGLGAFEMRAGVVSVDVNCANWERRPSADGSGQTSIVSEQNRCWVPS